MDKLLLDIDQLQKQIVPLKAACKDASSKKAVENMSKELEEHMSNCVVKKVSSLIKRNELCRQCSNRLLDSQLLQQEPVLCSVLAGIRGP